MKPILAIHPSPGSFSERWIEYCVEQGIEHKIVNCLDTSIIGQLAGVDGLLWNWRHIDAEEQLAARQVMMAAEQMGIEVYPNAFTSWYYDDKVAQKYLLEAIGAPLIPSYVSFDREAALRWVETASFPKVFKLRCGAGSSNVSLVTTRREAAQICREMFGRGRTGSSLSYFADARRKIRQTRDLRHFIEKLKRLPTTLRDLRHARHFLPMQRGYVYFQDYLPNNPYDTRVTVVGGRSFAFRRFNRPGDFRASGSGDYLYDQEPLDRRCIQIAADISKRLNPGSLACDFLAGPNGSPLIAEISYSTVARNAVYLCPGYWDEDLGWHEGHFWMQDLILQDLMARIAEKRGAEGGAAMCRSKEALAP